MSGMRFDTGALELDGAGNLVIDEDCVTVVWSCTTRRCVPLRSDVVRHLLHTEKKVYDGRGQGSRGGLVRKVLQRRRWQLHRVGLRILGLDGQGDPRPRRFLALLRKVGKVVFERQLDR